MGYFSNLYVVEIDADDRVITARTSVYEGESSGAPYFSWGPGERGPGVTPYARDTIFCDSPLKILPGYPLVERLGDDADHAAVEAIFGSKDDHKAVLMHFLLPENFVPSRDPKSIEQPARPFAYVAGNRVIATYVAKGQVTVRFSISRLQPGRLMSQYDPMKILNPEQASDIKLGMEINLFFVKFKLEQGVI